ncbi:hypothetical protein CICLE_v10018308mg [Citrus x clementina]|uniref:DUF1664 domain-containing protein n=1 Tax=Citrus clementina TaxID=85681 RepID=V4U9V4_CITCL|nr:uncharacterized protein LOC102629348 isoform X2 [Citrus sinensis]ESR60925.1 hypothetical protein CICLE_v10018308mg [Citrus x clementina]GAY53211.1 hypothetical protein CUMW_147660 [Citrus unshiu]
MALQAGVSTSKVIVLLGAGLTGSIVLRSGRLSEIIAQLQELLKGVDEVQISPFKYDSALLAAQIQQLSQEIKELTLSNPVTIFNGNPSSSGGYSSYLAPAAAIGAMGYCYMWWKGWSLSDVMFVTKHNMANAVASVSKQLEHVSETLASTKRQLSKRLQNLDWKLQEQIETSKLIANDEGKLELLEGKQDMANSGLMYLCQVAGDVKNALTQPFQEVSAQLPYHPSVRYEDNSLKGLQFLTEANESPVIEKSISTKKIDHANYLSEQIPAIKTKLHRSYPIGISVIDLVKS